MAIAQAEKSGTKKEVKTKRAGKWCISLYIPNYFCCCISLVLQESMEQYKQRSPSVLINSPNTPKKKNSKKIKKKQNEEI